jgi:hypothetical protein
MRPGPLARAVDGEDHSLGVAPFDDCGRSPRDDVVADDERGRDGAQLGVQHAEHAADASLLGQVFGTHGPAEGSGRVGGADQAGQLKCHVDRVGVN